MEKNEEDVGPIGECAGEILELIIKRINSQEKEFIRDSIEILTLCLSEIIKAGYCSCHKQEGVDLVLKLIQDDLNDEK